MKIMNVLRRKPQSKSPRYLTTDDQNGLRTAGRFNAELMDYIRSCGQTSWHPIGTCKMGTDSQAVVDPQLRVHGVAGLRVVDSSIMPTMPSSNTNAASIAIGEKAADMISSA